MLKAIIPREVWNFAVRQKAHPSPAPRNSPGPGSLTGFPGGEHFTLASGSACSVWFQRSTLRIFALMSSEFCPWALSLGAQSPEYTSALSPLCPPTESPNLGLGSGGSDTSSSQCSPWADSPNNRPLVSTSTCYRTHVSGGTLSAWMAHLSIGLSNS